MKKFLLVMACAAAVVMPASLSAGCFSFNVLFNAASFFRPCCPPPVIVERRVCCVPPPVPCVVYPACYRPCRVIVQQPCYCPTYCYYPY